jgi:SnoaL-like polyketide cyclase
MTNEEPFRKEPFRKEPFRPGRPSQLRFSVDHWAAFWANPHPELAGRILTPDVVGHWPGDAAPVRGVTQYKLRIARMLDQVPDLRLDVAEHARNDDVLFIRWVARGTGPDGPLEFSGVDRIRLRDGLVKENRIYYDPALLEQAAEAVR